jgi:hypothetical protein
MTDMEEPILGETTAEVDTRRNRLLMILVGIQAVFLAVTYAVGVWLTTEVHGASVTTPEVIVHGIASSGFATLTGLVGFLAAIQRKRQVALANGLLFALTVVAGATGFSFLGDTTDATVIALTNLSMMIAIGLGMPITGFSLATLSGELRGGEHGLSSTSTMSYIALGALSLTIIAGAAVPSASLYATAVAAHMGLAALTVSLVLGVLIVTILEASESGGSKPGWIPQRVGYSLLSLAAISIAAGDGVIALIGGGFTYIVVMAEVAVLVYAFLLFTITAPYHIAFHLDRAVSMARRVWPRRRMHTK